MNEVIKHPMLSETKRNVFISYAWEEESHQKWVQNLASEINSAGGNSIIDQKLKFGSSLQLFMDMSIKAADVVLMIMTPIYKQKAEILNGGVGYEYNIITKDLFKNIHKNEKYIGILRMGDHLTSVPEFLGDFKYVDLREGNKYEDNLSQLLTQILGVPLKHPEIVTKAKGMELHYEDLPELIKSMTSKAHDYFETMFHGNNKAETKNKIIDQLHEWGNEVENYHKSFEIVFNPEKMAKYQRFKEDFRTKTFRNNLWTVKAALGTRDPDLATYKANFRNADPGEIYSTVAGILDASHEYVSTVASHLNYPTITHQDELQMAYLDNQEMSMKQIIGFGIRSEILHRYYPQYFPIMTQQNLWAMYFICESANEFIRIEQKVRAGQMRVSHNWQYPYERFTYLMNELANQFRIWIGDLDLKWDEKYRFGYINLFLAHIHKIHKAEIRLLHEWS